MPDIAEIAGKVRLVSVKTDKYKTGQIIVSMALPMDGNLAANSLMLYLLKRSCRDYPDYTLLHRRLDELYGASLGAWVSKIGEAQVLNISITYLDDRFSLDSESISDCCAKLISGMIFRPNCKCKSFGAAALEEEKRLLIQKIESELDDKASYAYERCISHMCSDELYGKSKYGTIDEIKALKQADVYSAWKNMLETAVIQLSIIGSGETEQIASVFKKEFEKINRTPADLRTVFVPESKSVKHFEESQPINQGKLVMGFRAGTSSLSDNRYSAVVMNDIFGGGTYSKLFMNVREKMSLAYYCSSRFLASKGLVFVTSGINSDMKETVTNEVINQLSDLRNGIFDGDTLDNSKRSLRERYTFSDPDDTITWYAIQVTDEKIVTPEEMIEGIEKVSAEQVVEAANRLSLDTVFMLSAENPEVAQ